MRLPVLFSLCSCVISFPILSLTNCGNNQSDDPVDIDFAKFKSEWITLLQQKVESYDLEKVITTGKAVVDLNSVLGYDKTQQLYKVNGITEIGLDTYPLNAPPYLRAFTNSQDKRYQKISFDLYVNSYSLSEMEKDLQEGFNFEITEYKDYWIIKESIQNRIIDQPDPTPDQIETEWSIYKLLKKDSVYYEIEYFDDIKTIEDTPQEVVHQYCNLKYTAISFEGQ